MTKETLARMFNNTINGFYLEKDVYVYCEKRGGKKHFGIDDFSKYTQEEINADVNKPLCDFKTIDELFSFIYKGKTVREWIEPLNELNIDNFSKGV